MFLKQVIAFAVLASTAAFSVRPYHFSTSRWSAATASTPHRTTMEASAGRPDVSDGRKRVPVGIDKYICKTPDPATKGYIMQQTMLRVKDPAKSLDFYTRILGMRVLQELHFQEWEFSIYFCGYCNEDDIPTDRKERVRWCFQQPAAVELTHNWGTENDDSVKYHNGNDDPRGFGHIGVTVPDVYAACERFEREGVSFRKMPDGGNMKGLAFIYDPDGYSIEILSADQMAEDFSKYGP